MSEAGSGDIELRENMSFQRRQLRVERMSWVIGTILLGLALAGFTGRGPVASTERSDSEGLLTVSYDRIDRRDSRSTVELDVANPDGASEVAILISGHLVHGVQITSIHPEPNSMVARDESVELVVEVAPEASSIQITLSIEHEAIGRERSSIGLVGGPEVDLDQWILP